MTQYFSHFCFKMYFYKIRVCVFLFIFCYIILEIFSKLWKMLKLYLNLYLNIKFYNIIILMTKEIMSWKPAGKSAYFLFFQISYFHNHYLKKY